MNKNGGFAVHKLRPYSLALGSVTRLAYAR